MGEPLDQPQIGHAIDRATQGAGIQAQPMCKISGGDRTSGLELQEDVALRQGDTSTAGLGKVMKEPLENPQDLPEFL